MATWGTGISLKGTPGSKIYFGTGTPTDQSASAVAGDVFFSTDTFQFFQRTVTGWPSTGTSVQGPIGINGVNGNFYTGTGAPASSLGTSGNSLYINTVGEIYTRQSGGQWVDSNENLTGPQGPQGIQGIQGVQGTPGTSSRGSRIYNGTGAPSSDLTTYSPGPAASGDLYLDTASQTLYVLGN